MVLYSCYSIHKHHYHQFNKAELWQQGPYWYWINSGGKAIEPFDAINLYMDTGLFFIFILSNIQKREKYIIFYDQLSIDQIKILYLLSANTSEGSVNK